MKTTQTVTPVFTIFRPSELLWSGGCAGADRGEHPAGAARREGSGDTHRQGGGGWAMLPVQDHCEDQRGQSGLQGADTALGDRLSTQTGVL